jgi:hypothetical protein
MAHWHTADELELVKQKKKSFFWFQANFESTGENGSSLALVIP